MEQERDCRAIECIRGYCYCYCRRDTNKKGLVLGLLTFVQSEEVSRESLASCGFTLPMML